MRLHGDGFDAIQQCNILLRLVHRGAMVKFAVAMRQIL